jgi:hypothetical protein
MVKVLKFEVCNSSTEPFHAREREQTWFKEEAKKISTPEEIEQAVNDCINHYSTICKVIDVKVNTVNVHHHNNGGSDTVWLIYTIVFGG